MTAPPPPGVPHALPVASPAQGRVALGRAARVRTVLARSASAVLVLVLTGGAVAFSEALPVSEAVTVPVDPVAVPAAASQLVCPGPLRLPTEPEPGGDVAYDPQFDPSPADAATTLRAVVVQGSAVVRALGEGPDAALLRVPGGQEAASVEAQVEQPVLVRADADDDADVPWAAAAVGTTTAAGDLRGTVAASCQRPAAEAWLVGGSTALGSSARLVLQNPGRTAATVAVRLWGPAGEVGLAGAPEFLVPPGRERVVLLEGVAAEQRRIVVHLTASGGLVTGYLQDSRLRGLVPEGVDHVVAGEAPARRQVVTGLQVPETDVADPDAALLRLLAPDSSTTARVTLLGPDGTTVLPGTEQVRLEAGTVLDLPLGGLPAGSWTAVVEAAEPVVAGALVTRRAGGAEAVPTAPLERAWAPSVPAGLSGPLALPVGMPGVLLLAAVPQDGTGAGAGDGRPVRATVEVVAADGVAREHEVRVDVGTTLALPLAELLTSGSQAGTPPAGMPAEAAGAEAVLPETADGRLPAGVVLRTEDPRLAWAAVLSTSQPDGPLVSVVVPVRPEVPVREVLVDLR